MIPVTADVHVINFAPPTVALEVIQNVRTLLATRVGTVPMDRDFGLSWATVDAPVNTVKARVRAEVVEKMRRYEPRARVDSIVFRDMGDVFDGVTPVVYIEVIA